MASFSYGSTVEGTTNLARVSALCSIVGALVIHGGCGGKTTPASENQPAGAGTAESSSDEDEVPKDLVRLYLLADVTAVSPGQEFRLAARFDIEPSWHIYWTNPGEAGLPTTAAFDLPAGFVAEPVRYPGPVSFDGGEGIVSYGYEGLALLSSDVVAADSLSPGEKLAFSVKASWLACREMCIPGEAEALMSLDVASETVPSAPANAGMFEAHERALPEPRTDLDATWIAGEAPTLEITIPSATGAEYFPSKSEQVSLAGQLAVTSDSGVKLILSYKPTTDGSPATQALGVVRIDKNNNGSDSDKSSFHQLTLEMPKK